MNGVMNGMSNYRMGNSVTVCTNSDEEGAGPLIDRFLENSWILAEDWDGLPLQTQEKILWCRDRNEIVNMLIENNLLTSYQAARILAGTTFGMVLGSYRILERIGAGGMAVVFKAEHIDMRHTVAIKVLPLPPGQDARLESRFFSEMRVVARLRHPNIVAATDAGRVVNSDHNSPSLRYLVMEYVPGQDLEEYVRSVGALPIARGCNLVYQIASALAETNKYKLVHRDIKPSNIMVTSEEQAKLLDFGLSRHFSTRLTSPGTVLGTIDFMSPEQARDSSTVDIRSDIYSLGGVLFWCLTGQLPFPGNGSPIENLTRRLNQPPPSLRDVRSDIPVELDDVVRRMMATDAGSRYPTPQSVMQALLPFLQADCPEHQAIRQARSSQAIQFSQKSQISEKARVLIVDDDQEIRNLCRHLLTAHNMLCDEVEDGHTAIELVSEKEYDLVLLDVNMPSMPGIECLGKIRDTARSEHMKVIMFSGQASPDEMSAMLLKGADDYLAKPFSVVQFLGRVRTALRLKNAQDRSIILNQQLLSLNAELECNLKERDSDMQITRSSLVVALAQLCDQRDGRGRSRIPRLQRYCKVLSEAARNAAPFAGQIDTHFIELLEAAVPLYDIGKVSLPDHILLKGGAFTTEERILMQTHTTTASEAFLEVAQKNSGSAAFISMAIDVMRHHHERWDGTGYPDGLVGTSIPLSARIVAIADVYDALRCRRSYKPALAHMAALQIMTRSSFGQFDPSLIEIFVTIAGKFDAIFREMPD